MTSTPAPYSRPEGEWYLFPDMPVVDRYKRREKPWHSYVVLPQDPESTE